MLEPIVAGRWLEGYDRAAVLARISCPVLLLQADPGAGGMLPDDDAEGIVAALADCLHLRLPGVGHLIHWLETETTLRWVLGFVESLPRR